MVLGDVYTVWVLKVRNHWGEVIQSRAYLTLRGVRVALTHMEKQGLHGEIYQVPLIEGTRIDLEE